MCDRSMKFKASIAALGLAVLLSGPLLEIPAAKAQEASLDASKRRVRQRVEPEYPKLAREMRMVGKVRIETTVAADGHVLDTKPLGGNPLLLAAATDALKKWRFEPAPKETTEVIEFEFNGNN